MGALANTLLKIGGVNVTDFEKRLSEDCGSIYDCGRTSFRGRADLRANPLGLPIGCQTWPVRKMIAQDFPGTIKSLPTPDFRRSSCARR